MMNKAKKEYIRFIKRQYKLFSNEINNCPLLENVFCRGHTKHVLISYITSPFTGEVGVGHSNGVECYTAAETFDRLGFCVDVIHLSASPGGIDMRKYSVVYGLGDILIEAFKYPQIRTVVYATGCSSRYFRPATLAALRRFYDLSGEYAPESARLCAYFSDEMLYFADTIIALGNGFVADTYRVEGVMQDIHYLNIFYFDCYDIDLAKKDIQVSKRNYLWFGSAGCVHKGLDLVLEVFKRRSDIHLYVCGANPREAKFFEYYKKELSNGAGNITNLGFLDLRSEEFRRVMETCLAVIHPSASEGGAPSVVNVMANGGLIPLVSQSSGLDVEQYGFVLDQLDCDSIEKNINRILASPDDELRELARKVKQDIRMNYSLAKYKQTLGSIISRAVAGL